MWPNPQETADLDTFAKEILNGKFHFLCSEVIVIWTYKDVKYRGVKNVFIVTLISVAKHKFLSHSDDTNNVILGAIR